ncbi:hypothetical protein L195_g052259 [Trifolium pratense]|uniref:Uncharacterized protein n=1 Tax=Trifolium pratense TaxID=57577 RepID=A0A2K3JMX8_TRIPR|nr:hypothetical protein L195_g049007 [Trifolium pratense]PNX61059.1 hypothetical protein L195_g052259 [Trifolium pratense]
MIDRHSSLNPTETPPPPLLITSDRKCALPVAVLGERLISHCFCSHSIMASINYVVVHFFLRPKFYCPSPNSVTLSSLLGSDLIICATKISGVDF